MKQSIASEYLTSPSKRAFDVLFASSVGVLGLAGSGLLAAGIAVTSRVNPFYRQERVGQAGEAFDLFKLRTLYADNEPLAGGRFLRDTGLDELPQFYNILRGDMSVVGPRPLLAADENNTAQRLRAHFPEDSPYHPNRWLSLRRQCKPGATGPTQIMPVRADRGSIDHLAAVVDAECTYMENASMATDLKITASTPYVLLRGHNITVTKDR